MAAKRSHEVPATAAAFIFQFQRALFHLAHLRQGGAVGIETCDDVSAIHNDGSITREQDKLSLAKKGNPLTDKSIDLWKTLDIWVSRLCGDKIDSSTVDLIFATNRPVSDSLVRSISDAVEPADCLTIVARIRSTGTSDDPIVQAHMTSVLTHNDECLSAIISRISLEDHNPSTDPAVILNTIAGELGFPDNLPRDDATHALLGWLADVVMQQWQSGDPGWVTFDAFNTQKFEIVHALRTDRYRERSETVIVVTPDDQQRASFRNFVTHLARINLDPTALPQCIDDWIRFETEKSRLLRAGEVNTPHWDDFSNELTRRWDEIFRRCVRTHADADAEAVGHRIFDDTTQTDWRATLANLPTTHAYFTKGGYHALADADHLWWHPEYEPGG